MPEMESDQQSPQAPNPYWTPLADRLRAAAGIGPGFEANESEEDRLSNFVQAQARHDVNRDEVHRNVQYHFPNQAREGTVNDIYHQAVVERRTREARSRYANAEETWEHYNWRAAIPVVSDVYSFLGTREYGQSQRRIQDGSAKPEDYDVVAQHDRIRELDSQQSLGQTLGRAALQTPKMIVEIYGGMGLLKRMPLIGRLFGGAAGAAGEAASAAPRGIGAAIGRNVATTAVMPAMWLNQMAEMNVAQGRDATDIRGFPTAFGIGMANTAVLGSLGQAFSKVPKLQGLVAENIPGQSVGAYLQRFASRVSLGMAEQQAVDMFAAMAGQNTGYGVLGNMWNGRFSEAFKQAATQALTFGVFSGMHELEGRNKVRDAFLTASRELAKNGYNADSAGRLLQRAAETFNTEQSLDVTRPKAVEAAEALPVATVGDQIVKDYAVAVAETFPSKPATNHIQAEGPRVPAPISEKFKSVFPEAKEVTRGGKSEGGTMLADLGNGRTVEINHTPSANGKPESVRIDFDSPKVGGKDFRDFFAKIGEFTDRLKGTGVDLEFKAIERKHDKGYLAGKTTDRATTYAKGLEKAGWELIDKQPGGFYRYREKSNVVKPEAGKPPETLSEFGKTAWKERYDEIKKAGFLKDEADIRASADAHVKQIEEAHRSLVGELSVTEERFGHKEVQDNLKAVEDIIDILQNVKAGENPAERLLKEFPELAEEFKTPQQRAALLRAAVEAANDVKGHLQRHRGEPPSIRGVAEQSVPKPNEAAPPALANAGGPEVQRTEAGGGTTPAPRPSVADSRTNALATAERSAAGGNVVGSNHPESTSEVLYAPPGSPGQSPNLPKPGEPITPYQIIQQINHDVKMPAYEGVRLPGAGPEDMAYLTRQRAMVAGTMAAGDVLNRVHEAAHHISVTEKLALDPANMPTAAADGLKEFDYVPNRKNQAVAIQEGFAEWLKRRAMGQLSNLTPAQEAANKYAESLIKKAGLVDTVNSWGELLSRFGNMTAEQKAASLMSTEAPYPTMSAGENVDSWTQRLSNWWKDEVTNNLAVLLRSGMDKAYTVWSGLMFSERHLAKRFGDEGIGTLIDGKWQTIGPSKSKIKESLRPDDLSPMPGFGEVSRAEVFALARHILDENSKSGMLVPPHPHAQKTTQSGPAAGSPIWVAKERQNVSPEQLRIFKDAMTEFQKDPEFVKRATIFADNLTTAFNASRRALASPDIHMIDPAVVKYYEQIFTHYLPLDRVQDASWQSFSPGREKMGKVFHERSGSGEQIVPPLASYEKRLQQTAALLNEQRRRNAVASYLGQDAMGEWAIRNPESTQRLTEAGKLSKDQFEKIFGPGPHIDQMIAALGDKARYFIHEPWQDGKQNLWWWHDKNGELTNFIVKDKVLYDVLTHQQGAENSVAQTFKWLGKLGFNAPWGRVEPFRQAADLVRAGATKVSVAFNIRNSFWPSRDPYEFFKNTINRASVSRLPEMLKRVYAGEIAIAKGEIPKDEVFNLFMRERGEAQKMFPTTDISEITGRAAILRQWIEKATRVAGAGELGPRFLEFVNSMEKQGWTEKRLAAELEKSRDFAKQGNDYVDPVPMEIIMEGMRAANEVTVPFSRQGATTREINKIIPFFGPAVSGMSKAVRNWKENPAGASIAMGSLLTLRLMHWLAFRDEKWYEAQNPHDRYNNFVVPIPGLGLRRLPGPRDLEVPAGAFLTNTLDAMTGRHPDIMAAIKESFGAVMPPMVPPPVALAWQMRGNENWSGKPIVPEREQNMPLAHRITRYHVPYALQQLTGGRGEFSMRGAGLVPISEVRNATRQIDDYYGRMKELDAMRLYARRNNSRFDEEAEYSRMHAIEREMTNYNREYTAASTQRRVQIRERQNQLAAQAMRR